MTNNIENICYEFSDDCLFSQLVNSEGLPHKIIVYLQSKYIVELYKFLAKYGYERTYIKKTGKHFSIVHFHLLHVVNLDEDFFSDEAGQEA